MAIPVTTIHKRHLLNQIEALLTGLQRQMVGDGQTYKAMAQAQSPSLSQLAALVQESALRYIQALQRIIDLRANATRRQYLLDVLVSAGWSEQEIIDTVQALRQPAIALRDAQKTTYVQIITACDALLAVVDLPESLWPE